MMHRQCFKHFFMSIDQILIEEKASKTNVETKSTFFLYQTYKATEPADTNSRPFPKTSAESSEELGLQESCEKYLVTPISFEKNIQTTGPTLTKLLIDRFFVTFFVKYFLGEMEVAKHSLEELS